MADWCRSASARSCSEVGGPGSSRLARDRETGSNAAACFAKAAVCSACNFSMPVPCAANSACVWAFLLPSSAAAPSSFLLRLYALRDHRARVRTGVRRAAPRRLSRGARTIWRMPAGWTIPACPTASCPTRCSVLVARTARLRRLDAGGGPATPDAFCGGENRADSRFPCAYSAGTRASGLRSISCAQPFGRRTMSGFTPRCLAAPRKRSSNPGSTRWKPKPATPSNFAKAEGSYRPRPVWSARLEGTDLDGSDAVPRRSRAGDARRSR